MAEPPPTSKLAVGGKSVDSPMEDQVQKLANKVWKKYRTLDDSQRYLIAVAGIPGSGKTMFAASLAYHLNQLYEKEWHQKYPNAADYTLTRPRSHTNGSAHHRYTSDASSQYEVAHVLPMDGFHLSRAKLSAMPNPEEAHYRRGAAFTFDAEGYLALVKKLRKPIEATTTTIRAPSFDHHIRDPIENDIAIPRNARIVIIEGLYTALNYKPSKTDSPTTETKAAMPSAWSEACALMDEIWFISVPILVATERVAKRNFKAGLSPTIEAALERTVNSDMKNAREILENMPPADKLTEKIESVEDQGWKTQEQEMEIAEEERRKQEEELELDAKRLKLERMGSIAEMADAGVGM